MDTSPVAAVVAEGLRAIADRRVADALGTYLVPPRPCDLDWDYGHPHPQFAEPRYPGFVVAEFPRSGTGIAYSEYGSGPSAPWVLVNLDRLGFGMDCSWFVTIEDAFRESQAWDEPPPSGHEIR